MSIGFYPGCSLKGSAPEYTESLLAVAEKAGLELKEVPDWNCCGATAAHNLNHELSLALPGRILASAEKAGMKELIVPCAACYSRLCVTAAELRENPELRKKIADVIEMDFECSTKILNVIEFLERWVLNSEEMKIPTPFNHKVACYYGCLLVRPPKILNFDRPEDPMTMDKLMSRIGAEPIDWAFKTECCGAGFSVSRTDLVAKLSGRILEDAEDRGAEAVIVACPMCHSNLDMRRAQINKHADRKFRLPAIYITQAVGSALGIQDKKLGMKRHFVPVKLSGTKKKNATAKAAVPAAQTAEKQMEA
jgi:heterodisulfide reductase subunit B